MNRNKIFIKNTIINYIFKLVGIILGFLTIPMTLNYLGNQRFGIWQTILSIISWAALANFGIGNGLRNKISELISKDETRILKDNISSAYVFILKISVVLFFVLAGILLLVDTTSLFKNSSISSIEIKISFIIVALNFCVNFVLGMCNSIAFGIHKSYYVTIQQTLMSFVILIFVWLLSKTTNSNIIFISLSYSIINIFGNLILSTIIFRSNNNLIPTIKYNKKLVDKSMYNLGIKFFIVQICSMILASTDNFLIASLIGIVQVTDYSIVNKLFMTINNLFSIILIQLWNSTTDAFIRKDYEWIKNTIKKLLIFLIPFEVVLIIVSIKFNTIIRIWIGPRAEIDKNLVVFTALYIFLLCLNSIFINIQNGIGKIEMQIFAIIIAALVNIPCAYILIKVFNYGVNGVILANILSQIVILIFCPLDVIVTLNRYKRKDKKNENSNQLCE